MGVVASAAVVSLGTAAYAAWNVTGTGSAQARAMSKSTLTVSTSAATADLYPGASGKAFFTINNTNDFPITITNVSFGTVTSDDESGCPAATWITTANKTGLNITVAAKTVSAVQELSTAVAMRREAPDGCAGRTFTIATTVSGTNA